MKRVFFPLLLLSLTTVSLAQPPGGRGGGRGPGGPGGPGRGAIRLFDRDDDQKVTFKELDAFVSQLKGLDKNGDDKLAAEEVNPFFERFGPGRGPGGGPGGRGNDFGVSASDLEKESLAQDDIEKRILVALEEMRNGPRHANVSYTDGRLLRLLAESSGAKRVVEIGTSTGDSAVWLALAMQSTGGHVYTHEIDSERAEAARNNFKQAGVEELITLVFGDAHETVKRYKDSADPLFVDTAGGQSIDILFLDADKDGYIDYLDKLMPLICPGGLVIAHNMNTRQADARFVKAITENPQLETLILLKEGTGVGVTLKKR